ASARVHRDGDLSRAPRVRDVVPRSPDDGDAARVEERRGADRHVHAPDEPSTAGADHAGDPRDRRRCGRFDPVTSGDSVADTNGHNTGSIVEIKGVVLDAVFPNKLPAIYSALSIETDHGELIAEVQQHLGDD